MRMAKSFGIFLMAVIVTSYKGSANPIQCMCSIPPCQHATCPGVPGSTCSLSTKACCQVTFLKDGNDVTHLCQSAPYQHYQKPMHAYPGAGPQGSGLALYQVGTYPIVPGMGKYLSPFTAGLGTGLGTGLGAGIGSGLGLGIGQSLGASIGIPYPVASALVSPYGLSNSMTNYKGVPTGIIGSIYPAVISGGLYPGGLGNGGLLAPGIGSLPYPSAPMMRPHRRRQVGRNRHDNKASDEDEDEDENEDEED